ncbi:FAD:protein FMN transferase [Plantactinospora sp. KBS50]|uniref:FAD:protein FMN transferase n=1 Tax=Plantactinospora sp. KBS50 TaxID=2024580 RepID=UPI000BAAE84C|nr:FAD:protein FMN transferase [Plantactinospora sp. KBS50]ASW57484.1 thiamine biosynthesis protein [Plantactinospora sp. KBS50]
MGTAISIQLSDPLPTERLAELAERTFDWLREVDRRFSTYREDSEVNRFHRGELGIDECSPDLRHVLDACADLWRGTDGYFDAYATGRFDPSGYVKGWSVQVASDRLLAAGSSAHWINAGGDIRARGGPRPGEPWRIGIRHPVEGDRVAWVLEVTDLAIATSGTYERGRHVIDPRRGVPASGLGSVTVTGPDLGIADAYATAGLAMGAGGLGWLAGLPAGYEAGVITDELSGFSSAGLPVADDASADDPSAEDGPADDGPADDRGAGS